MRVCHLTSVHSRGDTRVFLKECRSLARAGHDVSLVVADGLGDSRLEGVAIHDVGRSPGRLARMMHTTRRVLAKAKEIQAQVYHLHDPELIPAGLRLLDSGSYVIFDAHEDVPKQLLGKPYLRPIIRRSISASFTVFERWAAPQFSAIIAATPAIEKKYAELNPRTITVNNYPMLDELFDTKGWGDRRRQVCYVGGVTRIRGARQMVEAMELQQSRMRLEIAGVINESGLCEELESLSGWEHVDARGFVGRNGLREIMGRSLAGLVPFLPLPNHIDAQPNKMFEYMSAGIPVIGSRFPLWQDILEGHDCGICVNPEQPNELAEALDLLANDQDIAQAMGANGRRAVEQKFNWSVEERKLLDLYKRLQQ